MGSKKLVKGSTARAAERRFEAPHEPPRDVAESVRERGVKLPCATPEDVLEEANRHRDEVMRTAGALEDARVAFRQAVAAAEDFEAFGEGFAETLGAGGESARLCEAASNAWREEDRIGLHMVLDELCERVERHCAAPRRTMRVQRVAGEAVELSTVQATVALLRSAVWTATTPIEALPEASPVRHVTPQGRVVDVETPTRDDLLNRHEELFGAISKMLGASRVPPIQDPKVVRAVAVMMHARSPESIRWNLAWCDPAFAELSDGDLAAVTAKRWGAPRKVAALALKCGAFGYQRERRETEGKAVERVLKAVQEAQRRQRAKNGPRWVPTSG